jgi:hypothetical protein
LIYDSSGTSKIAAFLLADSTALPNFRLLEDGGSLKSNSAADDFGAGASQMNGTRREE